MYLSWWKKGVFFLFAPVAWNQVDNFIQREDVNFVRFDQEERIRTDIARSWNFFLTTNPIYLISAYPLKLRKYLDRRESILII